MYLYYSALPTAPPSLAPPVARKLISFPDEQRLKSNTLLKVIPQLHPSYTVKFELKPSKVTRGWSNIVHFTTGGNCCGVGDRIPGVWFYSGTTKLLICSAINNIGELLDTLLG